MDELFFKVIRNRYLFHYIFKLVQENSRHREINTTRYFKYDQLYLKEILKLNKGNLLISRLRDIQRDRDGDSYKYLIFTEKNIDLFIKSNPTLELFREVYQGFTVEFNEFFRVRVDTVFEHRGELRSNIFHEVARLAYPLVRKKDIFCHNEVSLRYLMAHHDKSEVDKMLCVWPLRQGWLDKPFQNTFQMVYEYLLANGLDFADKMLDRSVLDTLFRFKNFKGYLYLCDRIMEVKKEQPAVLGLGHLEPFLHHFMDSVQPSLMCALIAKDQLNTKSQKKFLHSYIFPNTTLKQLVTLIESGVYMIAGTIFRPGRYKVRELISIIKYLRERRAPISHNSLFHIAFEMNSFDLLDYLTAEFPASARTTGCVEISDAPYDMIMTLDSLKYKMSVSGIGALNGFFNDHRILDFFVEEGHRLSRRILTGSMEHMLKRGYYGLFRRYLVPLFQESVKCSRHSFIGYAIAYLENDSLREILSPPQDSPYRSLLGDVERHIDCISLLPLVEFDRVEKMKLILSYFPNLFRGAGNRFSFRFVGHLSVEMFNLMNISAEYQPKHYRRMILRCIQMGNESLANHLIEMHPRPSRTMINILVDDGHYTFLRTLLRLHSTVFGSFYLRHLSPSPPQNTGTSTHLGWLLTADRVLATKRLFFDLKHGAKDALVALAHHPSHPDPHTLARLQQMFKLALDTHQIPSNLLGYLQNTNV